MVARKSFLYVDERLSKGNSNASHHWQSQPLSTYDAVYLISVYFLELVSRSHAVKALAGSVLARTIATRGKVEPDASAEPQLVCNRRRSLFAVCPGSSDECVDGQQRPLRTPYRAQPEEEALAD